MIPRDDYADICAERGFEVLPVEQKYPILLHQRVSKIIAAEAFGVSDAEVLSAIGSHTTLSAHPSEMDMAVFIADKLSWDQDGIPPFFECVSHALQISLKAACLVYIDFILDNKMVFVPHPYLLAAKAYFESLPANKQA